MWNYLDQSKKEYDLIKKSDYEKFPPRLFWQPIFYSALNQEYAERITGEWNAKDENSHYNGEKYNWRKLGIEDHRNKYFRKMMCRILVKNTKRFT